MVNDETYDKAYITSLQEIVGENTNNGVPFILFPIPQYLNTSIPYYLHSQFLFPYLHAPIIAPIKISATRQ